jgi:hypothetical protein
VPKFKVSVVAQLEEADTFDIEAETREDAIEIARELMLETHTKPLVFITSAIAESK